MASKTKADKQLDDLEARLAVVEDRLGIETPAATLKEIAAAVEAEEK